MQNGPSKHNHLWIPGILKNIFTIVVCLDVYHSFSCFLEKSQFFQFLG